MQRRFRLAVILSLVSLPFLLLGGDVLDRGPDRHPQPIRLSAITYQPVAIRQDRLGPFRSVRVWRVTVADPRFGGLSALAATRLGLLALTDSGALIDLPIPDVRRRVARVRDLPAGPGWPTFKRNRDTEALAFDPRRNGWWVTFEYRHGLWLFDSAFRQGRLVLPLEQRGWPRNKGIEALLIDDDGALLLLPERGRQVVAVSGSGVRQFTLVGAAGEIADAVRLPDGRTLVSQRAIGPAGITNRLAWLVRGGGRYRLLQIGALALGPLDNVEGLAAERLPEGGTRVWAVTDNDGWRRTLLVALDLPPTSERRPRQDRGGVGGP